MIQRKVNEVFTDSENFKEPKRIKCVEDDGAPIWCESCAYNNNIACKYQICIKSTRDDNVYCHFIKID